ncbi:MAG: LysM peptidoglycan-binding domain-containing protein [Myxococcota bacterium]
MLFRFTRPTGPTLAAAIAVLALALIASPAAAERVHVVARGHTLGKIAKRYHVTIEQLCEANEIRRRDPLKVGQRIVIPDKDAKEDAKKKEAEDKKDKKPRRAPSKRRPSDKKDDKDAFTTHVVARGHTLGKIARRFRTSVQAIRDANNLRPGEPLKVGLCLLVPLNERASERQRTRRLPCLPENVDLPDVGSERRPHNAYAKRPRRSGVVHLVRGGRSFRGRLFNSRGQPISSAIAKVDGLLFDRRTAKTHSTDAELLRTVVKISNHFGGRRLIIVSGFRQESSNPYTTRSNHALGKAIDFRIEGVPNEALRDFCHRLTGVGVGYYPNSSFIHLDVRSVTTHWTDVSGPGEAPRYTSVRGPKKTQ